MTKKSRRTPRTPRTIAALAAVAGLSAPALAGVAEISPAPDRETARDSWSCAITQACLPGQDCTDGENIPPFRVSVVGGLAIVADETTTDAGVVIARPEGGGIAVAATYLGSDDQAHLMTITPGGTLSYTVHQIDTGERALYGGQCEREGGTR